jgi:hypothetical protein
MLQEFPQNHEHVSSSQTKIFIMVKTEIVPNKLLIKVKKRNGLSHNKTKQAEKLNMGTETKYTVLLFIKVLCNLYFGNTITKSKEDRVLPLIGVTVCPPQQRKNRDTL